MPTSTGGGIGRFARKKQQEDNATTVSVASGGEGSTSGSNGVAAREAAKKGVAVARKWTKAAADAVELAQSQLRTAQSQLRMAQDAKKEAELFLESVEKRYEVIDVDLEDDAPANPAKKRQRTVSLSPRQDVSSSTAQTQSTTSISNGSLPSQDMPPPPRQARRRQLDTSLSAQGGESESAQTQTTLRGTSSSSFILSEGPPIQFMAQSTTTSSSILSGGPPNISFANVTEIVVEGAGVGEVNGTYHRTQHSRDLSFAYLFEGKYLERRVGELRHLLISTQSYMVCLSSSLGSYILHSVFDHCARWGTS